MMAPPKTLAAAAVSPSRILRRMGCMYAGDHNSLQFLVLCSQLRCRTNGADQAVQNLPQFSCFVEKVMAVLGSKVCQVLSDDQLRFDFHQRSSSSSQKEIEFVPGEARLAFGNVGWNCHRRSPQLTSKRVCFVTRKTFGRPVNVHDKIHGLLPCNQLPVRLPHK